MSCIFYILSPELYVPVMTGIRLHKSDLILRFDRSTQWCIAFHHNVKYAPSSSSSSSPVLTISWRHLSSRQKLCTFWKKIKTKNVWYVYVTLLMHVSLFLSPNWSLFVTSDFSSCVVFRSDSCMFSNDRHLWMVGMWYYLHKGVIICWYTIVAACIKHFW